MVECTSTVIRLSEEKTNFPTERIAASRLRIQETLKYDDFRRKARRNQNFSSSNKKRFLFSGITFLKCFNDKYDLRVQGKCHTER